MSAKNEAIRCAINAMLDDSSRILGAGFSSSRAAYLVTSADDCSTLKMFFFVTKDGFENGSGLRTLRGGGHA